jgi:hypothetical protein
MSYGRDPWPFGSVPAFAVAEVWPMVEKAHAAIDAVHRAEVERLTARIRELEAKLAKRKRKGRR